MRLFTSGNATPSPVSRYLLPDERQVVAARVHPASIIGPLILALAGLAAVVEVLRNTYVNTSALIAIWLTWGVLMIALLARADQSFGYFVVTSNRILITSGLVYRNVQNISFTEVADVNLRRSPEGLLLGYGELVAKATDRGKTLPRMRFVPYPEEVYREICFIPVLGDSAVRSVFRIQKVLDPVSPFKVVRSLERAAGNQGADSLTVARERFYSAVADGFDEDESLARRPELRHYLSDYRVYLRRRKALKSVRTAAIYLTSLIDLVMIVAGSWLSAGHGTPNAFWISFTTAVAVAVLASVMIWLITRRIRSVDSQLTSAASQAGQQMSHEFRTLWLEFSLELEGVTDHGRRLDPMLRSFDAPALVELESSRVQRSASFEYILEFLENHITSAVGVSGPGCPVLLRMVGCTPARSHPYRALVCQYRKACQAACQRGRASPENHNARCCGRS